MCIASFIFSFPLPPPPPDRCRHERAVVHVRCKLRWLPAVKLCNSLSMYQALNGFDEELDDGDDSQVMVMVMMMMMMTATTHSQIAGGGGGAA